MLRVHTHMCLLEELPLSLLGRFAPCGGVEGYGPSSRHIRGESVKSILG